MILLTGGHGRLGTEIKKRIACWTPSQEQLDITKSLPPLGDVDLIVHAAAYTDVDGAETNRAECDRTNVFGTRNLVSTGIPMIYISTDSVFDGEKGNYSEEDIPNPVNFYSLTKLLGEREVRRGLIVRCSPRVRPWEREGAYTDRFFSAEYMDEVADKIVRIIEIFPALAPIRILHIGSKRRSHYEMAIETKPEVKPLEAGHSVMGQEIYEGRARRGRDLSLDCSLWESLQ